DEEDQTSEPFRQTHDPKLPLHNACLLFQRESQPLRALGKVYGRLKLQGRSHGGHDPVVQGVQSFLKPTGEKRLAQQNDSQNRRGEVNQEIGGNLICLEHREELIEKLEHLLPFYGAAPDGILVCARNLQYSM